MNRLSRIACLSLLAILVLSGCGAAPTPALIPTRTPQPTFTPTPDWTPTPALAPTKTPTPEPTATPTPAEPPTAVPTNTSEAKPAAVVTSPSANVRTGPTTAYPLVGRANRGDRLEITGKNANGTWWQVCCVAGKQGWIINDLVRAEGNLSSVPVVTGIAPPPAAPTRLPQPTATPVPAAPPPTAAPAYAYRVGNTRCFPNSGITYIEGKVLDRSGAGKNGVTVVFSYAPDGPPVASYVTGTDPGKVGGYTHIIQFDGPREGTWSVWTVDGGRRSSAIATVKTDGVAGDGRCQQANVDFVQN